MHSETHTLQPAENFVAGSTRGVGQVTNREVGSVQSFNGFERTRDEFIIFVNGSAEIKQ
jgi:hypothetical protein